MHVIVVIEQRNKEVHHYEYTEIYTKVPTGSAEL